MSFGRYVYTRLKRAKLEDLAQNVDGANKAVKAAARAVEDANEPVQDGQAVRDSIDDDLDDSAQNSRLALGSRSLHATDESPYKDIFPRGIEYYTAAPQDKEVQVFSEFKQRLETHLPATDAVRTTTVPLVTQGLTDYAGAIDSLTKARNAHAILKTALETAEESWGLLMEKTYGALVARFGKRKAERYFPRRKRAEATENGGEASETPVPGTTTPG
ncbi:MAG: hypothetical protein HY904_16285 [Deltaproteobacteria bacterium]|nr:hypothetical protein [Deltaproteobacteria bacterium]